MIKEALDAKGWVYVRDLKKIAEDNNIPWNTFRQSKPNGVKVHSVGFNEKTNWWSYENKEPS